MKEDTDQLQYEREQYKEQLQLTSKEESQVESQLRNASVKANEVVVVTSLIEEKSRLDEQKKQLKKNCKEEKARLDAELEKAKQRRLRIEDEDQN